MLVLRECIVMSSDHRRLAEVYQNHRGAAAGNLDAGPHQCFEMDL